MRAVALVLVLGIQCPRANMPWFWFCSPPSRYLLCSSDCESLSLQETLASADTQSRAMWENLSLGYTESNGSPALREEIAKLYTGIEANGVLVGAPQELILIGLSAEIEPGDHVLVTWPGYQSLCRAAFFLLHFPPFFFRGCV